MLFSLEHAIQDASSLPSGERRTISRQMLYVELAVDGMTRSLRYAPYLDYLPLEEIENRKQEIGARREEIENRETHGEHSVHVDLSADTEALRAAILSSRSSFLSPTLEQQALGHAIAQIVPGHLQEVRGRRLHLIEKTRAAVVDTQASAARARAAVMAIEHELGFTPFDREFEQLGYDIESRDPTTGQLRFIEVKGRVAGAETITVTKNEILDSLNTPDHYILALVEFETDGTHQVYYLRRPFQREPDFGVTSVNYTFAELLARATEPS